MVRLRPGTVLSICELRLFQKNIWPRQISYGVVYMVALRLAPNCLNEDPPLELTSIKKVKRLSFIYFQGI